VKRAVLVILLTIFCECSANVTPRTDAARAGICADASGEWPTLPDGALSPACSSHADCARFGGAAGIGAGWCLPVGAGCPPCQTLACLFPGTGATTGDLSTVCSCGGQTIEVGCNDSAPVAQIQQVGSCDATDRD
jgi:hypothetical protein